VISPLSDGVVQPPVGPTHIVALPRTREARPLSRPRTTNLITGPALSLYAELHLLLEMASVTGGWDFTFQDSRSAVPRKP